jgi:hypothetical protein
VITGDNAARRAEDIGSQRRFDEGIILLAYP